MDQITHDVRRSNWLSIIKQCQDRPEGMTAKQWMADNSISPKSYYYWLRKFRKESYGLVRQNTDVSFHEMPFPVTVQKPSPTGLPGSVPECQGDPAVVIRRGETSIAVMHSVPPELMALVLKEVLAHA